MNEFTILLDPFSVLIACYTLSLSKPRLREEKENFKEIMHFYYGPIVLEMEMLMGDGSRTTHDDERQRIAKEYLSDSGYLKIVRQYNTHFCKCKHINHSCLSRVKTCLDKLLKKYHLMFSSCCLFKLNNQT